MKTFVIASHYSSLFHEAQAFRFVNGASSSLLKKAEGESINPKRTENFNLIIGPINLRTRIQWIILVSKSTQVKPIPIEAIQSINKINSIPSSLTFLLGFIMS